MKYLSVADGYRQRKQNKLFDALIKVTFRTFLILARIPRNLVERFGATESVKNLTASASSTKKARAILFSAISSGSD